MINLQRCVPSLSYHSSASEQSKPTLGMLSSCHIKSLGVAPEKVTALIEQQGCPQHTLADLFGESSLLPC